MGAVSRLAHVPLVWCVWPERGTRVADGVFRLPSPPQGIREPATEAEVRSLPFEGNDQGAPGGQGVGQSRRRKMEEEGRGFRRRETQKGF